ncbi:MAG: hypothetical protein ACREJ3_02435 [Polyangiaceae bacterium]
MHRPNVENVLRDEQYNVTYRVLAYRRLTRVELLSNVGMFHAQPKNRRRKRPITDKEITILTLNGANGGP